MPQADSKSSSGQERQQTVQTAPYPTHYPQQFEDDTIDLYELWITIWNWKRLVILVTVVTALCSIVYALQQQDIYKSESLILQPKSKDIPSLHLHRIPGIDGGNTQNKVVLGLSAKKVFSMYKQNLNSRTLHKKFIHENGLMELLAPDRTPGTRDEDIYKEFSDLIKLGDVNGTTSLSIELHDAEIAAQWINNLIEFVDKETIAMLVEDLRNSIVNQIRDIENTIESKRQMVKKRREDQILEIERTITSKRVIASKRREDKILRYKEAAKTAKSLGIMKGLTKQTNLVESTSSGLGSVSPLTSREKIGSDSNIAQMYVDIATATTPLFFIGYDALNAELDNLNTRVNEDPFIPGLRDLQEQLILLNSISLDDPFIEGLRDLQEQLVLLRTINFNEEKMTAVHIDQAAYPANSPIKPNRRLIISLGTVVGLFSGIFLAFFIEFVQNQRKKHLG